MSGDFDKFRPIFSRVCAEWNRAEGVIKNAEFRVGAAVTPSINELRYAGRRIIEAMCLMDCGKDDDVRDLLADAEFDCMRAQHDAIDATVFNVAEQINNALANLPSTAINAGLPEVKNLLDALTAIKPQITASRQNRNNRKEIYAALEKVEFSRLLEAYDAYQARLPFIEIQAKQERRALGRSTALAWAGLIATILTFIVGTALTLHFASKADRSDQLVQDLLEKLEPASPSN